MEKDISLNIAGYSKALHRVTMDLVRDVFQVSLIENAQNDYSHVYGYRVFVGDGTYTQLRDTEMIRSDDAVKCQTQSSVNYPKGLLEVLIEQDAGQIQDFKLSNRHVSELSLFHDMIDRLPAHSLALLDDLCNCFETLKKCRRKEGRFVVPSRRFRRYDLLEERGVGDKMIHINVPAHRSSCVNTPLQALKV